MYWSSTYCRLFCGLKKINQKFSPNNLDNIYRDENLITIRLFDKDNLVGQYWNIHYLQSILSIQELFLYKKFSTLEDTFAKFILNKIQILKIQWLLCCITTLVIVFKSTFFVLSEPQVFVNSTTARTIYVRYILAMKSIRPTESANWTLQC